MGDIRRHYASMAPKVGLLAFTWKIRVTQSFSGFFSLKLKVNVIGKENRQFKVDTKN